MSRRLTIRIDAALDEACVDCPLPGWTAEGGCVHVEEETLNGQPHRYLTTACGGAIFDRRQKFPDTDVTFSYRFTAAAMEGQRFFVQTRHRDADHRAAIIITPDTVDCWNDGEVTVNDVTTAVHDHTSTAFLSWGRHT